MSLVRRGIARLDDARPEPLELGDPGLGGVARLGLTPVADLRRAAQEPDREPVEPRLGNGRAGKHRPEQSPRPRRSAPSARRCRVTGRAGRRRRAAGGPSRGFSPTVPQAADGSRIEQPVSVPSPRSTSPAASAAALPPTSRPSSCPGCERVVARCRTTGSLRARPRRTRAGSPCRPPPRRRRGRAGRRSHGARDVIGVDARAVRRADPGRVDQVLDEQRAARERPRRSAAQRLVEPGDRRRCTGP